MAAFLFLFFFVAFFGLVVVFAFSLPDVLLEVGPPSSSSSLVPSSSTSKFVEWFLGEEKISLSSSLSLVSHTWSVLSFLLVALGFRLRSSLSESEALALRPLLHFVLPPVDGTSGVDALGGTAATVLSVYRV